MHVLQARALVKRFGPKRILDRLDLDLEAGECLALFGPNGAGKTTLLRVLAGLARPEEGRVEVSAGATAGEGDAGAAGRRRIGYAGHRLLLYPHLTARENLRFHAVLFDLPDSRSRVEEVLERVALADRGDDALHTFSRGMSQRLALGRALLHDPEILLLDEPFSGLDPDAAASFSEILKESRGRGRSILMTSHNLERGLDLADSVAVLARGKIRLRAAAAGMDRARLEEAYARLAGTGAPS